MSGNLPPGCTQRDIDEAAGYWDYDEDYEPIYRTVECRNCKREMQQDDQTRRWYLLSDVEEFGMYHMRHNRSDALDAYETKEGWFCCTQCEHDPEYQP